MDPLHPDRIEEPMDPKELREFRAWVVVLLILQVLGLVWISITGGL